MPGISSNLQLTLCALISSGILSLIFIGTAWISIPAPGYSFRDTCVESECTNAIASTVVAVAPTAHVPVLPEQDIGASVFTGPTSQVLNIDNISDAAWAQITKTVACWNAHGNWSPRVTAVAVHPLPSYIGFGWQPNAACDAPSGVAYRPLSPALLCSGIGARSLFIVGDSLSLQMLEYLTGSHTIDSFVGRRVGRREEYSSTRGGTNGIVLHACDGIEEHGPKASYVWSKHLELQEWGSFAQAISGGVIILNAGTHAVNDSTFVANWRAALNAARYFSPTSLIVARNSPRWVECNIRSVAPVAYACNTTICDKADRQESLLSDLVTSDFPRVLMLNIRKLSHLRPDCTRSGGIGYVHKNRGSQLGNASTRDCAHFKVLSDVLRTWTELLLNAVNLVRAAGWGGYYSLDSSSAHGNREKNPSHDTWLPPELLPFIVQNATQP